MSEHESHEFKDQMVCVACGCPSDSAWADGECKGFGFFNSPERQAVYDALGRERDHQDRKWGTLQEGGSHSLAGWLLILEDHLQKAKAAWNRTNTDDARRELVQCAAIAVAALEEHGPIDRQLTIGELKSRVRAQARELGFIHEPRQGRWVWGDTGDPKAYNSILLDSDIEEKAEWSLEFLEACKIHISAEEIRIATAGGMTMKVEGESPAGSDALLATHARRSLVNALNREGVRSEVLPSVLMEIAKRCAEVARIRTNVVRLAKKADITRTTGLAFTEPKGGLWVFHVTDEGVVDKGDTSTDESQRVEA